MIYILTSHDRKYDFLKLAAVQMNWKLREGKKEDWSRGREDRG